MFIMIVDDHADMQRLLKHILMVGYENILIKDQRLEFVLCSSGEDAVSQFQQRKPDVIIMDFQLGKMNGMEASERILQSDPKANILFVSSYDSPSIRNKIREIPSLGFISKRNLSEIIPLLRSRISNHLTL